MWARVSLSVGIGLDPHAVPVLLVQGLDLVGWELCWPHTSFDGRKELEVPTRCLGLAEVELLDWTDGVGVSIWW